MSGDRHLYDEIPRLLSGEADRTTVQQAPTHLRACADCTEELISAVVAHASLRSAARYAPDIVVGVPTPPDGSSAAEPIAEDEPAAARQEPEPLPDLSSMFARIREETQSGASAVAAPPRRVRRLNMKIAVAAAVVGVGLAGGAGYYAADQLGGAPSRTIEVSAFGVGHTTATATLVGSRQIELNASSLPPAAAGHYYEVWLTDPARKNLAPVGPLTSDRTGNFEVSPALLDTYSAIEVSVQNTEGTGAYSGTSVLRGVYR